MAVISSEGIIYMKDDFESEWITIDSSQTGMKSVALTGAKSLVIVGNEGAIWQYTGQTWWNRTTSFTENLHDVDFNGDEDGLAVGDSGAILATDDGGDTWD